MDEHIGAASVPDLRSLHGLVTKACTKRAWGEIRGQIMV